MEAAQYLSDALRHNTVRLVHYSCSTHIQVQLFTQTLITLNLKSNEVGCQGAEYLCDALRHNTVYLKFFSYTYLNVLSYTVTHNTTTQLE